MASDERTTKAIPIRQANLVIKMTTQRLLVDVRHAFGTMPAVQFSDWLQQQIERAENLP